MARKKAEAPKEKQSRIVIAVYRDDAVEISMIQSDLWKKAIESGNHKKPSVADAVHSLILAHKGQS